MEHTFIRVYIDVKYWKEASEFMEILVDNNHTVYEVEKIEDYPNGYKYRIHYSSSVKKPS